MASPRHPSGPGSAPRTPRRRPHRPVDHQRRRRALPFLRHAIRFGRPDPDPVAPLGWPTPGAVRPGRGPDRVSFSAPSGPPPGGGTAVGRRSVVTALPGAETSRATPPPAGPLDQPTVQYQHAAGLGGRTCPLEEPGTPALSPKLACHNPV